jgi:translocation and assembly module TamB
VDGETSEVRRRRVPRWARIALASLLAFAAIAVAILWTIRVELATDYIDGELARRGVQARYDVKRIGLGTQIFENLVIGDPRRPDLTARRVEVQILVGFTGPRIGLITARGVRMAGRIEGGRLRLGQIDRLLPPPSGAPFRLPDQRIDVKDAAIALATPAGDVALALSGRGNLADGFRGGVAIASRALRLGGCVLAGPVARFTIRITDGKPRVHGPAAMHSLRCGEALLIERPLLSLRSLFAPGLDSWRGSTAMRVSRLSAGGPSLTGFQGHLTFAGDARETAGEIELESADAAAGAFRAGRTRLAGHYGIERPQGLSFEGALAAQGVTMRDDALADIAASLRGTRGTPVGPIGEGLAGAMLRAGRGGAEVSARLRLVARPGGGALNLGGLRIESLSGARLVATGGQGIDYSWPLGILGLNGGFALSGGGFPDARFVLNQPRADGPIHGSGRIAPMAAGGALLALGEITFSAAPDGRTSFRTVARIDGPFGGGRVAGLTVPLAGRFGAGGFALGEACVGGRFAALQVQSLRLGPSRLALCPAGRAMLRSGPRGIEAGAELRSPRFAGRLGASPIALAAERLRVDRAGLAVTRLAVRLGPNRLDIAGLDGRFGGLGVAGGFAGLSGDLAAVPLLVGEGRGRWRFERGRLVLDGRLAVADRLAPARFVPLASEDFRLVLAAGRIEAGGTLVHPQSGTRVMTARIGHDLAGGAGSARIEVDRLRFSPGGLQPDVLTPLTVGVVALVDGAVSGQGRIEWDARGTSSSGAFTTADMALAAPFGPVEGLATRIDFTDLLGLVSAPGQEARVRLIRTGIDVYDGIVRYQLRPDYHVAVESARWPLAGGTLTLRPTMLDFSRESTKYLTFEVDGLDAARFIQLMEFSNIAATGTYDGIVPMQFTNRGGRIVAGRLVARQPGGTLSYVGELSDRDLGPYGVLAFDALKSLRYSRLEISLDGALDGEFLTRIDMDGLARNPGGARRPSGGVSGMIVGRVLGQLARIPFHFNIRISGPFRALVATARSFEDPSELIRASLPQLLERENAAPPTVQPEESEPVR